MNKMLSITHKALLGHLLLFSVLVGSYFLLLDQVVKIFLISKVKQEVIHWIPDLTSPKSVTTFKELARCKAQQNAWLLQIFTSDGDLYYSSMQEMRHVDFYKEWDATPSKRYHVSVPMTYNDQDYKLQVVFDPADLDVSLGDVRKIYVFVGAFFSIVFILLSFVMLALFSRPIQAIFRTVNAYAMGGESQLPKLKVEGNCEAAVFAKTLNQLSDDIHSLQMTLSDERQKKSAIIEALGEGVITVNPEMQIADINVRGSKLIKMPKIELIGKTLGIVCKENIILKKCQELAKTAMHNHALITDSMVLDDEQSALDLVAVPLGVNKGLAIILQDGLSNNRVVSLGKEFIANASHELRTPITIIKGFAEMLHDLPEISETMLEDITDKIVRNCHRMSVLVKNLLVLADLDNLPKASLKEHDLLVILENCRHQLLALHPDITITIDAPSEALILSIDGPLIELAIMNLFENAAKYSSTTAKISVKIRGDKGNIVIDISDQGIGIGKKELDHIFDRFYTVNKAHTRKMGGAGLGLSIVRNIVEKHGGELSAQSTIGQGTTFTLTLPHAEITALV